MKLSNAGFLAVLLSALAACARAEDEELPWCIKKDMGEQGMPIPSLPEYYSANLQLNYVNRLFSSEVTRILDRKLNRSVIEVLAEKKHTKYISLQKDDAFLTIDYTEEGVSCSTKQIAGTEVKDLYATGDKIIAGALLGLERLLSTNGAKFSATGPVNIKGIYVQQWLTCAFISEVNEAILAKISFADSSWKPSHPVYPTPVPGSNVFGELVQIEMKIPGKLFDADDHSENIIVVDFSRFLPFAPADDEFQPPEDVHCPDFRTDVNRPSLPNYFRYNAEVIIHTDSTDVAPIVTHRTVYYDYTTGLTRIDLQDTSEDETETTAPLGTLVATVISDFKAGVEYIIDPSSGSCEVIPTKDAFDVLSTKGLSDSVLRNPRKFFYLDDSKISFLGKYSSRGLKTNVFSSVIKINEESRIFRWYFTVDKVRLIEDQEVQKNVLVKLVSKPESGVGKKGMMEINLYNFIPEEPTALIFDVSSCYNETMSKTFVLSFPGKMNPSIQGATTILKLKIHQAIKETAGVSQTRVAVQEVIFKSSYLYAQFKILDLLPFGTKSEEAENNLDEAVKKLQTAVSGGTFEISLTTKDNAFVTLKPDPFGLKEYSKEEEKQVIQEGLSKGSVGGLVFGMILLGFLIGGVVVNLVISRKHGVSLFQKAGFGNPETSFNNPLNESSM